MLFPLCTQKLLFLVTSAPYFTKDKYIVAYSIWCTSAYNPADTGFVITNIDIWEFKAKFYILSNDYTLRNADIVCNHLKYIFAILVLQFIVTCWLTCTIMLL